MLLCPNNRTYMANILHFLLHFQLYYGALYSISLVLSIRISKNTWSFTYMQICPLNPTDASWRISPSHSSSPWHLFVCLEISARFNDTVFNFLPSIKMFWCIVPKFEKWTIWLFANQINFHISSVKHCACIVSNKLTTAVLHVNLYFHHFIRGSNDI